MDKLLNTQISEFAVLSSDVNEFQAVIIILIVALAVVGMIVTAVRRSRSIKDADQFTHDRVENALHSANESKKVEKKKKAEPSETKV